MSHRRAQASHCCHSRSLVRPPYAIFIGISGVGLIFARPVLQSPHQWEILTDEKVTHRLGQNSILSRVKTMRISVVIREKRAATRGGQRRAPYLSVSFADHASNESHLHVLVDPAFELTEK